MLNCIVHCTYLHVFIHSFGRFPKKIVDIGRAINCNTIHCEFVISLPFNICSAPRALSRDLINTIVSVALILQLRPSGDDFQDFQVGSRQQIVKANNLREEIFIRAQGRADKWMRGLPRGLLTSCQIASSQYNTLWCNADQLSDSHRLEIFDKVLGTGGDGPSRNSTVETTWFENKRQMLRLLIWGHLCNSSRLTDARTVFLKASCSHWIWIWTA